MYHDHDIHHIIIIFSLGFIEIIIIICIIRNIGSRKSKIEQFMRMANVCQISDNRASMVYGFNGWTNGRMDA